MAASDDDFDFTFAPSGIIYGARAIKLDTVTQGGCYVGSLNSMCVGVTPQQSEYAPGQIGNNTYPYILGQPPSSDVYAPGSVSIVPVYGPMRRCLIDVDPSFGGQIKPGDLVISSNTGYATKATPTGPWNQWIIGVALSYASAGQSLNIKVMIFPWMPTGS